MVHTNSVYIKAAGGLVCGPGDVFGQIQTQASDTFRCDAFACLSKLVEHMGHIGHIVKHHRVGHQGPILAPLLLLHRVAAAQHRPTNGVWRV